MFDRVPNIPLNVIINSRIAPFREPNINIIFSKIGKKYLAAKFVITQSAMSFCLLRKYLQNFYTSYSLEQLQ